MIERLHAGTDSELSRIGGKGAGLVRLLSAGLEVPEAWVIPATVSLDDSARSQCAEQELPAWWAEVSAQYPDAVWAVRSSAVAEDLEGASFAGVYETVLGVDSAAELAVAVKHCWAAIDESRATSYLATQQMGTDAGIALILQRMIRPRASGVMLTENPLAPFGDDIVIDAAYGLGEAVVSGRTHPDHVVLHRTDGTVVTTLIGAKEIALEYVPEVLGLQERQVSQADRERCSLSDSDLTALHGLAAQVEKAIGPRRDLEWAIEADQLYVLQDRPITGLPPREPKEVWTRRFGDEYLAEYVSPLGNDLMIPWLTGAQMDEVAALQKRPEIMRIDKLRRIDGHIYLNAAYAVELARAIPLEDRDGTLTAWFDRTYADVVRNVPYEPKKLVSTLLTARKDKGRGSMKDNLVALERHCATIDEVVVPWLQQDYTALSREEWKEQYAATDRLGNEHFRVIRWGMGQHGPILQGLLTKFARDWTDGLSAESFQALISGLPGTRTAEINRDVWSLGSAARRDPKVLEALRSDASYDDLRAATSGAPFWGAFDAFLQQHGHRSSSREVSADRWHEQPDVVLGLVRAQVRPEEQGANPEEFEARAGAKRLAAEKELMDQVGRGPKRAAMRKILTRTQQYTVYRENQRYHLDYLLDHLHLLLLEQGRRFAARGDLPAAADVFLLGGDRFWQLVDRDEPMDDPRFPAELEASREHRAKHSNRLPASFFFDGVPTEGVVEAPQEVIDGAIMGFGASSGKVRGVVRNVPNLAELSTVCPGDVLVASNIDPGWTSVFPMIGGLITETGGILCHGAILAREYGIPTVTSIAGATTLLPTGTVVEVDGNAGSVVIIEDAE